MFARDLKLTFKQLKIFCSGEDCGRLYKILRIHLGKDFTIPGGEAVIPGKR